MVRNIQLKHSGKYVCMVHTVVDSVSAAAHLIVRGTHTLRPCDDTLVYWHTVAPIEIYHI
jgi:hypothetical protein